jgi:hypothetical protein
MRPRLDFEMQPVGFLVLKGPDDARSAKLHSLSPLWRQQ